tara:strand:- start:345 stop:527 length:183 start_codon:yes stop_codon:yes gene_type:complete
MICCGTGQAALFTSLVECSACKGLGWWLPDDYKEFFGELSETNPEVLIAIAKYYIKKLEK